jgi:dTDP-glucose pyrophosphorylase
MNKKERIFVSPELSIRNALRVMDEVAHKTVIVTDSNNCLLGVASDGDVRRCILQNGNLDSPVHIIMNRNPLTLCEGYSTEEARDLMRENMIEVIPVVAHDKRIVSVCFWAELFGVNQPHEQFNLPVVIMAGGQGTRLYPFTKILPKPLIPIGEKPIIEHIIDRFLAHGCNHFYATVNYKANMLRAYFNDLERSYDIQFVEEDKPLGTCGSLHLLDGQLDQTFFVSNCDILIDADYSDILRMHRESSNLITVIASLKHYTVPYGIIHLNGNEKLKSIQEKPELTWLVNTGLYVLEPQVLRDVPKGQLFHITDLINNYLEEGKPVGVYPVSDKAWMDMGQFEQMREMIQRMEA